MILFSALLSLLASGFQLYLSYRTDLSRIMAELDVIETSFLIGLGNALWNFNFDQVEVLVEGIFAQADIVGVDLAADTGQQFLRGEMEAPNSIVQNFPLQFSRPGGPIENVGELTVVLSLDDIQSRLFGQFLALVASNFLKTLAASALMLLIFERMVSRHLRKISGFLTHEDWDIGSVDLALDRSPRTYFDDLHGIVTGLNASKARLQSSRKHAEALGVRMEAILNAATSGIIAFDGEGLLAAANPQAQHMLGITEAGLPCPWPDGILFLEPENMSPLDASSNPIERALSGQNLKNETAIMSRKLTDRDPRYVRMSSARLPLEDSSNIKSVVVIDDISEQEKNRQQVERASRLDALGQLTGGVAHDFNNLLSAISYGVDLAKRTEDATQRGKYLDTISLSVERGASLTKRLLAFAKRQPGVARVRSMEQIFGEFEALVRPTLEETIDLRIKTPPSDLLVYCDVAQLENALLNLVINARDAIMRSGKGREIIVEARPISKQTSRDLLRGEVLHGQEPQTSSYIDSDASSEAGHVEISVSDDGPGMSDEVRRRALDPFFTTKDTNSGTGLGLSMVYGFVQQSDGILRIYSESGFGTTIRLFLPRGTSEKAQAQSLDPVDYPQGGGQIVLLVEDEESLSKIMSDVVESLGYRVVLARDGKAALEILKSPGAVDCLLTDVIMPGGISGFDLAKTAREIRPEIKIIYMSGYTGFSETQMGSVVAPILAKPTPPDELALALRAAISPDETSD